MSNQIKTLPVVTTQFPVTYRHMDDTVCTTPDECQKVRLLYIVGGNPNRANWEDNGTRDW